MPTRAKQVSSGTRYFFFVLNNLLVLYSQLFQFHHSSYAAFCRNYGDYATRAERYRCWNEEAISSMRSDMSGLWDTFITDVDTFLDRIPLSIEEVFRNSLRATGDTGKLSAVFPLY